MNRLIVLQKKALRVLTFSRFDVSSEPLFKRLKVMSLKERLVYNSLIYIFKALHSLSSINSGNYIRYKTQRSSARNVNKFQLEIRFTRLTALKTRFLLKVLNFLKNLKYCTSWAHITTHFRCFQSILWLFAYWYFEYFGRARETFKKFYV
jgi:hypothetical protein